MRIRFQAEPAGPPHGTTILGLEKAGPRRGLNPLKGVATIRTHRRREVSFASHLMTIEIGLVFLVVALALYLFASQTFRLDVTALLILVTLMTIPLVGDLPWLHDQGIDLPSAFPTVREGLSGLSSTATVTVLAMFILSAGVQRSGLIHLLGKKLLTLVGGSELRQILIIALLVAPISGFINNTAAVAVAIPLVLDMTRRAGLSPARMLIPVSFFGMLGGTLTVIGTSTNILASSILRDRPEFGRDIGMFEFTSLGVLVLTVGLLYFLTVGRWLLPASKGSSSRSIEEEPFLFEFRVVEGSDLISKSLKEAQFRESTGVEVQKLVRGARTYVKDAESMTLCEGDVLMARGQVRQIMDLIRSDQVEILSDFGSERRVRGDGLLLRIVLRNPRAFDDRSAGEVDFWGRYGVRLLGFEGQSTRRRRLADEKLKVGGIALVETSRTTQLRLRRSEDVAILGEHEDHFDKRRMILSAAIVAGVVAGAALTPVPIVVTALLGVILMAVTGCLDREEMYSGVSWEVIFLLAGVIPLGVAMSKSGAADWIGNLLASQAAGWHPILILVALYAVTTLLTELVSNNASVVVLVPVAISIAQLLDLNIFPLVLAVMFAASTSFLSPVGYQTNSMIFGTGLYQFTDFIKVGGPLNVLLMLLTSLGIYWLFPLARP